MNFLTKLCFVSVVIICEFILKTNGNFGLTAKKKLPSLKFDINVEADVIARKGEEGLLQLAEDGSYVVPATEYEKIDLSVEPELVDIESPKDVSDSQEPLLRTQRRSGHRLDTMLNDDNSANLRRMFYNENLRNSAIKRYRYRMYQNAINAGSAKPSLINEKPTQAYARMRPPTGANFNGRIPVSKHRMIQSYYPNIMQGQTGRRYPPGIAYRRQLSSSSSNDKRSVDGKPYGKRHLYGQYRDLFRQQAINSQLYQRNGQGRNQNNKNGEGHVTDKVITSALLNLHHAENDDSLDIERSPKWSESPSAESPNHSRDVGFFLRNRDKSSRKISTVKNSVSNSTDLGPTMHQTKEINRTEARAKCENMNLSRKQLKMCKRDSGMPQVLEEATRMAASECQYQFRYERWNCSLGSSRIFLLNKGTRETAFLFAISSAGLTHSVARACANGHLERCSCEETYSDHLNQEAWRWGGCGDNVRFATKFVRQFLKSRGQGRDIRAEVDKHNSDLGIRMVKQSVEQTCKCHGVSGSCTTKTCWRKVAPFYEIGRKIKKAYDKAVKVGSVNRANGRTKLIRLRRGTNKHRFSTSTASKSPSKIHKLNSDSHRTMGLNLNHEVSNEKRLSSTKPTAVSSVSAHTKFTSNALDINSVGRKHNSLKPKHTELVFLEKSPKYCTKSKYSEGTKGRICDKSKNCDKICCNRGYTVQTKIVKKSCECEIKWCCYVKCKTCIEEREVYTCK